MKFGRSPETQTNPEVTFVDPFEPIVFNPEALAHELGITMQSGAIKTAIEKVAQAMRPVIAKERVGSMLLDWYTYHMVNGGDRLARVDAFLDHLVPPEVTEHSATTIERYSRDLVSIRLLHEANDNHELAAKMGQAEISEKLGNAYAALSTSQVRDGFVQQFEAWCG